MTTTIRWKVVYADLDVAALDQMARDVGLAPVDGKSDIDVEISLSDLPDETYLLEVEERNVTIVVGGTRSLRWALCDIADRLHFDRWAPGDSRHSPAFAVRGIIEGFYGPPWSDTARLDMIDFAASVRLNTFLYSPKDDPLLRHDWRVPFDEQSMSRLRTAVQRCHERHVDPVVGISPGLTMQYSDPEDRRLLADKAASVVGAGASKVALLLDDIPNRLQHPGDIDQFPHLAAAHAEVANHLFESIEAPLTVCPTVYRGNGEEPYVSDLGDLLDPQIDLFWTGRAICSPAITVDEAAAFARSTHRPPLYWDNYPVNDLSMRHEMHIGPYENRDPLLGRFSRGVMANAMSYPEASKIPFATIADYLWDPGNYDPESSWRRAIERVVGEADARAFWLFADNLRVSCLSDGDPHRLTRIVEDHAFLMAYGDPAEADRRLGAFADELGEAAHHLLGPDVYNQTLQQELSPWLEKFRLGADALAALARGESRLDIDGSLARLMDDPHRVFGDVLEMTLAEATEGKET